MKTIEERLKEPFPARDIEWRAARCGISKNGNPWVMCLAYIDARAVQDRLDLVAGIFGWHDEYEFQSGGMVCHLTLSINGQSVTKVDGSPETQVESFKGGFSKALVRTAAKWGIGRYLYNLTENFAKEATLDRPNSREGWHEAKDKTSGKKIYWRPPQLPDWALPKTFNQSKNASDYVLQVGHKKGKRLCEYDDEYLISLVDWIESETDRLGKKELEGLWKTTVEMIEKHMGVDS